MYLNGSDTRIGNRRMKLDGWKDVGSVNVSSEPHVYLESVSIYHTKE